MVGVAGSATAELLGSGLALLRLLQLASPALPIGAYAYSRGLESAVANEWVGNEAQAHDWIEGVIERSVACLDAPVLARLHAAFATGDAAQVARWNDFLCASRESAELALEDRQLGLSLGRLLAEQGVEGAAELRGPTQATGYVTFFALACVRWNISRAAALAAYMFAFAENQVTCAIKLLPLGQTAGQRILARLIGSIDGLVAHASGLSDADLGSYTPGLAMASALHETQYTRLFRS